MVCVTALAKESITITTTPLTTVSGMSTHQTKQIGGAKNGQTRTVPDASQRAPKWYPADDIKEPKKNRKNLKPSKLRASVSLLSGSF
jgi:hypothetical protein